MAFTAETGDHKVTRSDIFLVDPRALVVDWKKNLTRNGEEPPVDDALIELARDMMPKKGQGDAEDGTSGQLNPILARPLPDRRLEVIGGFRRMRAALWLIESGTCPDFKVKYVVSRLSDAEAALVNLTENIQREDPKPIQLAHAVRSLTEDYGLTLKQVAGRLKRSEAWLLQPAQPRDAAHADPGERGEREDPGLGRPGTGQAPDRQAGRDVQRPGCRAARRSPPPRSRQKRQETHEATGRGRSRPPDAQATAGVPGGQDRSRRPRPQARRLPARLPGGQEERRAA